MHKNRIKKTFDKMANPQTHIDLADIASDFHGIIKNRKMDSGKCTPKCYYKVVFDEKGNAKQVLVCEYSCK